MLCLMRHDFERNLDEIFAGACLVATRYLDPFRNGFGQTVVAPYSVRRREQAPVSMPLAWPEVKPTLVPADFNIGNFEKWSKRADPWKEFFSSRQSLNGAVKLLKNL